MEVKVAEGKIAQFVINKKTPLKLSVPFQVTENTCNSHVNMYCEYRGAFGADFIGLTWKTHPDASKVNTSAKVRMKGIVGNYQDIFELNIYGAEKKMKTPIIAAALPMESIVCKDYSWLPQGKSEAPEKVNVSRWDVELMFTNPETGLTENRTFGVAVKVNLIKNSEGSLDIKEVKKYTGSTTTAFFGDIWSFVLPTGSGDFCFVSMKPNLVGFDKKFVEYLSEPPKWTPYLYQTDEYTVPFEQFRFQSFVKTVDNYDFE